MQLHNPPTRQDDLIEMLHGVAVADPYRWLEDGETPETRAWVDAQNERTREYLDSLPFVANIRARLDELFTTGSVGTPVIRGTRYFYQRRDGTLDQPILVVRDQGIERTILDPNAFSASGLVALDWWYPSDDGRLVAIGLSEGGTELSTLHVLDVDGGERLQSDQIPHTRAASIAWLPDSSGFYYTRYPLPGSVPAGEEMYNRHVYFHTLGRPWQEDPEVFGAGRAREDWPNIDISSSGRWLAVEVQQGWARSELYLLDRQNAERGFIAINVGVEAMAHPVFAGDRFLVHTNRDAPNWALFEVDPAQPSRENWRQVIPERPDLVLDAVHAAAGRLIAHEMHNATSEVRLYNVDGTLQTAVKLPG